MKTIQFTDEEIDELFGLVTTNNYTISSDIRNKFKLARLSTDGSLISGNENEIITTPAKSFEKVSERTQAARIENEKRVAKQMIESLERKCEELVKENEALNLQITNN